jgi:hypothetical protein
MAGAAPQAGRWVGLGRACRAVSALLLRRPLPPAKGRNWRATPSQEPQGVHAGNVATRRLWPGTGAIGLDRLHRAVSDPPGQVCAVIRRMLARGRRDARSARRANSWTLLGRSPGSNGVARGAQTRRFAHHTFAAEGAALQPETEARPNRGMPWYHSRGAPSGRFTDAVEVLEAARSVYDVHN